QGFPHLIHQLMILVWTKLLLVFHKTSITMYISGSELLLDYCCGNGDRFFQFLPRNTVIEGKGPRGGTGARKRAVDFTCFDHNNVICGK
ncbi:hypothetical protein P4C99_22200, partial [Pontiellaceae bacterium B1224]|nr:hypothetical protein [Pontiellaceae bacterium B1224]